MEQYVIVFRALSDKTRLKIMWLLSKANKELCVCEIMDSLNESQYRVSRHLRELKIAGLLKESKEGRWVFYYIEPPTNQFHRLILKALLALPEELFALDSKRLNKRLALRKNGKCVVGMKSKEWHKILNQLMGKKS